MTKQIFNRGSRVGRHCRWLGLIAMLSSPLAGAISQEILAEFRPDSSQPNRNVFINKTPESGYCAQYPAECKSNNMFSIRLPIMFRAKRPIFAGNAPEAGATFTVPAEWRQLTVRNTDTQQTETVEVRITGIGSRYELGVPAAELVGVTDILEGHKKLWGSGSWVNAPPPCVYSGVGMYGPDTYGFFWKTPKESACAKIAQYFIPDMLYSYLDFAYELRTPNPLRMSAGRYVGEMNYVIGPGGDFDMGQVMLPTDGALNLNFVLDVQHTLKVDIPPGGEKIRLEPSGGWQQWMQSGRRPTRLFRDQTFLISASSKFRMRIECELQVIRGCGIRDDVTGAGGSVLVSVSLPDGLTDEAGNPIKKYPLSKSNSGMFQPGQYVDRKPGVLHFEMSEADTSYLIRRNEGRPFRGLISVIWDSQI